MGGKEHLASVFYTKRGRRLVSTPPTSWLWPSCKHPMTHSFREEEDSKSSDNDVFDRMNPSYLESSDSCFSDASEAEYKSFSTVSEAVARGMRSDRLFFEPGSGTSSIMEEAMAAAKADGTIPFEGTIAMEVDSEEPYWDFRLSMEEVVMAQGVMDVQWLEEMLCWYLKMNGKPYHGIIVEAFLDLLLCLAFSSLTSEMEDREENNTR